MTAHPDDYEPTEADIDRAIEEATGNPVKPEDAWAGIASMRQRIAELQAQKAKVFDHLATATDESADAINQHLDSLDKELAAAGERLAHYEAQLGKRN